MILNNLIEYLFPNEEQLIEMEKKPLLWYHYINLYSDFLIFLFMLYGYFIVSWWYLSTICLISLLFKGFIVYINNKRLKLAKENQQIINGEK